MHSNNQIKMSTSSSSSSSCSRLLVLFTILVLLFDQNVAAPSPPTEPVYLPLKTKAPHHHKSRSHNKPGDVKRSSSASAPKKVAFQHNVALTVSLTVGTPPQNVTMVVATGSGLTWLQCNKAPMLASVFDSKASKSYKPVPCSSSVCKSSTQDLVVPASCDQGNKYCHVAVSYADGSALEGTLAQEQFNIGGSKQSKLLFTCMESSSSTTAAAEDTETTGIMGLNLGSLSFAKQMKIKKFAYCIPDSDAAGFLFFGSAGKSEPKGIKYTPLVKRTDKLPSFDRMAYSVQLEGIKVNNQPLVLPKTAFQLDHTGAGQTMMDSATQFSFLTEPAYTALKNEILKQTKGLQVYKDKNYVFQQALDFCFEATKMSFMELPKVTLMFQGGAEITLETGRLVYSVPELVKDESMVYCFTFGSSALLGIEANVIGNYHQQNIWVQYDLEKSRVGFAPTTCQGVDP